MLRGAMVSQFPQKAAAANFTYRMEQKPIHQTRMFLLKWSAPIMSKGVRQNNEGCQCASNLHSCLPNCNMINSKGPLSFQTIAMQSLLIVLETLQNALAGYPRLSALLFALPSKKGKFTSAAFAECIAEIKNWIKLFDPKMPRGSSIQVC